MALIKCKGCGHMVSTKAEKCPKCGFSVRLSMEREQEEAEQSVEARTTTLNTQEEVVNDYPQPQSRGSKKGVIISIIIAIVIIGCCILFAILQGQEKDSNQITQQSRDIPTIEANLQNVTTIQDAKQLIEGTVWEHTVNTDESELGYWVKVEFANGRYKTFYMNPSDEDWTNGGEGVYEIKDGKFSNTGEKYIAVYWEGGGCLGWPMKYALVLNNFQITATSVLPDLDALFSYEPRPTYSGFMKLVDIFEVHQDTIIEDELPSDSVAVATENDDFVVSDSCVTEAWENITLYGSMTDANGTFPIELSFEKSGDRLMNCIYTNVDLGGKIRMEGEIADEELLFIGKDGNNIFRICVNSHTLKGYAQDGDKRLEVLLGHNRNDSQNTLQQGSSWLQETIEDQEQQGSNNIDIEKSSVDT